MSSRYRLFGRRFSIDTDMSPAEMKATVQGQLVDWFDPSNRPRGWIAGRFVHLWNSAASSDEIVFAFLTRNDWRWRLIGLTASDLAAALFLGAAFGLLASLVWQTLEGEFAAMGTLPIGLLCLAVIAIFVFWPRKYGDGPVAAFLRRSLAPQARKPAPSPHPDFANSPRNLRLQLDGKDTIASCRADDIVAALDAIEKGKLEFAILEVDTQEFMQVALKYPGFVVEKRAGGEETHVTAHIGQDDAPVTKAAALSLMLAYLHAAPEPPEICWEKTFA